MLDRSVATTLCWQAIEVALSYEDLKQGWPLNHSCDPWLAAVREDLAAGGCPLSGALFTRVPLWEEWYRSYDYKMLVVDLVLLETPNVPDESCRAVQNTMARTVDTSLSDAELRQQVQDLLRKI